MEDNKNTFTQGPSLTLEPGLDPEPPKGAPLMEAKPEMDPVQKEMAETVLTEEEQKMVDAFAEKIDVENTNQILQYGAGTQKKMADFSDEALENVKSQDLGEVGDLLAGSRRTEGF